MNAVARFCLIAFEAPVAWIESIGKRRRQNKRFKTLEQSRRPSPDWTNPAVELEKTHDWPALARHAERWTKAFPKNIAAWEVLAGAYCLADQTDNGIRAWQHVLRICPDSDVWRNLSNAYADVGRFTEAIEALTNNLPLRSDYAGARRQLRKWRNSPFPVPTKERIEQFQNHVRINPDDADVWRHLGEEYRACDQFDEAEEALQRALRVNGRDDMAWYHLAGVYFDSHRDTDAEEALRQAWFGGHGGADCSMTIDLFQRALRIHPDDAKVWRDLGVNCRISDQVDSSPGNWTKDQLMNALSQNRQTWEKKLQRVAQAHRNVQEFDALWKARHGHPTPLLQQVIGMGGQFAEWIKSTFISIKREISAAFPTISVLKLTDAEWLKHAEELCNKNRLSGLLRHSRRWTKARPDHGKSWYYLGIAYGLSGRTVDWKIWNIGSDKYGSSKYWQTAKAIEAFQQALRLNPDDAEMWSGLSLMRENCCAEAWKFLGDQYIKDSQFDTAMEAYQNAVRINPRVAEAWDSLGRAYVRSGQISKAIDACQHAVENQPNRVWTLYNLGVVYRHDSQIENAMEVYSRLKTLDPKSADRFFNEVILRK